MPSCFPCRRRYGARDTGALSADLSVLCLRIFFPSDVATWKMRKRETLPRVGSPHEREARGGAEAYAKLSSGRADGARSDAASHKTPLLSLAYSLPLPSLQGKLFCSFHVLRGNDDGTEELRPKGEWEGVRASRVRGDCC